MITLFYFFKVVTAKTIIVPKKDLYNSGKCFTKNKEYVVYNKDIRMAASLMETTVENDLGESHIIGSWWREFDIKED